MTMTLSRRAALLALPVGLAGCETLEDLFTTKKDPIPGDRIAVMGAQTGMAPDAALGGRAAPPPATPRADAPQPGVSPSHVLGHPTLGASLRQAWNVNIGEGGGYRAKILAQPVVAGGRVFAMDSDGAVSAYDAAGGGRAWRIDTQAEDNRSTNIGGGLAFDGGMLFASTGRGEVLALDPASGAVKWRKPLGTAARAAPTVAEGRVYVGTLDDQMVALAVDDGRKLWSYQALNPSTAVLGLPAPAFQDGLLVCGFGSGDLIALRAISGSVAWSDSLASSRGRNSLLDLATIHAMPVIASNIVVAVGLGGLMLGLDLRSGRRLWERNVGASETPCVAGDWVFVVSSEQLLAAVALSDGRVAWATQLPVWGRPEKKRDPITWAGPVLAGGRLILAGTENRALPADPTNGAVIGTQELSGTASVAPVVAGDTLYIVTDDGHLIALR